ncbi:MAG: 16S rRNA (cytidine1402-2'-O)-methyltransferase [Myxococcota bacterium]
MCRSTTQSCLDSTTDLSREGTGPPDDDAGTLYVVATPIGNLDDITLRALKVLKRVDRILCEDTRVTRTLMDHFGLRTPLLRHDAHTEAASSAGAVQLLEAGETLAIVSDAGTPGVSDPGHRLVRAVLAAGLRVVPIPGASALTTLICIAGLEGTAFAFHGFVEKKTVARAKQFAALQPGAHVFYLPARDLVEVTQVLATVATVTQMVIGRELTKAYERCYRGSADEVLAALDADAHAGRGEAVMVITVRQTQVTDETLVQSVADLVAQGESRKGAVAAVAERFEVPRKRVYRLALGRQ